MFRSGNSLFISFSSLSFPITEGTERGSHFRWPSKDYNLLKTGQDVECSVESFNCYLVQISDFCLVSYTPRMESFVPSWTLLLLSSWLSSRNICNASCNSQMVTADVSVEKFLVNLKCCTFLTAHNHNRF